MPEDRSNPQPYAGAALHGPSRADSWEEEWRTDGPGDRQAPKTGALQNAADPRGLSLDAGIKTPIYTGMALAACVVCVILVGMAVLNYGVR